MRKKAKSNLLREYFAFNKSERRGIFMLLGIITLVILGNIVMPYALPRPVQDFTQFDKEVTAYLETQEVIQPAKSYYSETKEKYTAFDFNNSDRSVSESNLNPFDFDPNTMTAEQWKALGMDDKQIKTLENYKAKGGKFYKKEDFKKMFCISENEYTILEPFIKIPDNNGTKKSPSEAYKKPDIAVMELNTASSEELDKLPGIGQYFVEKIINYKLKLGGYYCKEQLKEINKMNDTLYLKIEPYIIVNPKIIRKINVNTATYEELQKHPYIGYNVALSLVNYRDVHGKYKVLADIKKSVLVKDALYEKIKYYLSVE
jgi:DNA uptake protein ComE-like DNA-binding protein